MTDRSAANKQDTLFLSVSFNQDQGCFAIGHEHGFLVYNTNPIDLRVNRQFKTGRDSEAGSGIGLVSMLHRTNYLALVGGGVNPKFPITKLLIWDDLKRRPGLTMDFMSSVLNVLLSRVKIIVVLLNQVQIYEFSATPQRIASYETIENKDGVADLSVYSAAPRTDFINPLVGSSLQTPPKDQFKGQILAFPGRAAGQVQLVDVSPEGHGKNDIKIIKAHKSKIRILALNRTGTLVASASDTGTIIRVHSTQSTALVHEFRRGFDRAIITAMKFSGNDTKLAVMSDKTTLHVFNLSPPSQPSHDDPFKIDATSHTPTNKHHVLGKIPLPLPLPILNYFQSTWSYCSVNTSKYHTNFDTNDSSDTATLGWSGNDTIILVWKKKQIWEKYDIVEDSPNDDQDNKTFLFATSASAPESSPNTYSIIRSSWRSIDWKND